MSVEKKCDGIIGQLATEAYERCPHRFRVMRLMKTNQDDLAGRELLGWFKQDTHCKSALSGVANDPACELSAAREVSRCMLRLHRSVHYASTLVREPVMA